MTTGVCGHWATGRREGSEVEAPSFRSQYEGIMFIRNENVDDS